MNTQTIIIRSRDVEAELPIIPNNVRLAKCIEINAVGEGIDVFAELHPKSSPAIFADEIIKGVFRSGEKTQVFIKLSEQIYRDALLTEVVSRLGSVLKDVQFNVCSMPKSFSKETSATHKLMALLDDRFGKKFVTPYPIINVMDEESNVIGKLDLVLEMAKDRRTGIGMIAFGSEGPKLDIKQILETCSVAYFSVKTYMDINHIEEPKTVLLSLDNGKPTISPLISGTVLRKTPSRDKIGLHTTVLARLHPGDKLDIAELYPMENGVQYAKLVNGQFVVISEQGVRNIQITE